MAVKEAFCNIKESQYKTRDASIEDVGGFDSVELSVMLCNDGFIRKLNNEWRGEDHATDVLSMSQHIPGVKLPVVRIRLTVWCILFSLRLHSSSFEFVASSVAAYVGRYRNIC